MRLFLIALITLTAIFLFNYLSAQPKTMDDLIEFKADGVYAKHTFTVVLPFWPHYKIQKGWKIANVMED